MQAVGAPKAHPAALRMWRVSQGRTVPRDSLRQTTIASRSQPPPKHVPNDPSLRSAAALLEDPARRADLLNAFPTLVWCADGSGQCSFVNQAWEDYTGRPFEAESGMRWLESVHPGDRTRVTREWDEALGLRRPLETQYRLLRGDGEYGWLHHSAVPVYDENGRLQGYLGSCTDITEQRSAELRALYKEREIRTLADNVPVLIAYYDREDLRCRFANRAYAQTWGMDETSIVGKPLVEIIGEAGYAEIKPHVDRVLSGEVVTYERAIRDPRGQGKVLEVNLRPHRAPDGRPLAAFVLIHDITRHRLAEQRVRDSEERLRKFADASRAGIVFHDEGRITDCNEALAQLTGYSAQELIGSEIIQYVAPEHRERALENVRTGYERPYESEIVARDGSVIPVEFEGRVMPLGDKVYRLSVVRDIRRRKQNEARIDFLAHHDQLTGLPNRALLRERLEFILASARRRGNRAAVLFIDLDNFKVVNDSLGHAAGDELLKVVAARLPAALRAVDVVSRHGGDEFLVVLPDVEDERAPIPVAEKILAAIGEPMLIEGQSVTVSPSIGIAVFPRDGENVEELVKNADAAMYLAKERGRSNYQFFNKGLAESAQRAFQLETRMREAIRSNGFLLHYQPQVRVTDGAVIGVEALIRWPQQGGDWIEPSEFIPVAEQRGLVTTIGRWVVREACRQAKAWQDQGLAPLPVAVNLSPIEFRQRDFAVEVERVLMETGLEARWLAFELTERMLMGDLAEMARTLEALKRLGVGLAIDDFGTGHSSLMHLKRFPIDKLKIDRTFVRDMPGDADDMAITGAVIDLARNMGITSIAEGVDRLEQLEFLRARGCDEAQGYLFCRALPPEELAGWLAKPHSGTITKDVTA
jgi:diguanylate cyclase (GGDEF)-like protein/PAS domain S-box-containing protein